MSNNQTEKICKHCNQEKKVLSRVGTLVLYDNCDCPGFIKETNMQKHYQIKAIKNKEKLKVNKILQSSNILKNEINMSFKGFQENDNNSKAKGDCMLYVKHYLKYETAGTGIFIIGTTGIGKTHLAVAVAISVVKKYQRKILLANAIDIVNKRIEYYNLINCDLLVIDDLGTENNSDYARETMYSILDRRYRSGKINIITTNLSKSELAERYKKRLMSRMSKNGVIEFTDYDHRVKQKK